MAVTKTRSLNLLTLVVSVYNEEDSLQFFWDTASKVLRACDFDYEILFVNDGSIDSSLEILKALAASNSDVRVINFSRNYGHEAAMLAGIDHAKGDAIICMDADCQHPPSIIPKMVQKYKDGVDAVNMIRTARNDAGLMKRITSKLFYKFLNKISPVHFHENASDFFLISHKIATVIKKDFRERTRFLRGIIQIVGFKNDQIEFEAVSRQAGESKYSFSKLLILSMSAIVSFSKVPLYLGLVLGSIFSLIAIIVGIYSMVMFLIDDVPPGYTTLVVFIAFSFAILFFLIGIIGMYIGYMFDESKKRPIYVVDEEY